MLYNVVLVSAVQQSESDIYVYVCVYIYIYPLFFGFPSHLGFPGSSDSKVSACSAGDLGSIPGSGRSPGEGNGNPLQYPSLENLTDRVSWWAAVHGVAKSRTRLSD